jgi:hypothetical protein
MRQVLAAPALRRCLLPVRSFREFALRRKRWLPVPVPVP